MQNQNMPLLLVTNSNAYRNQVDDSYVKLVKQGGDCGK